MSAGPDPELRAIASDARRRRRTGGQPCSLCRATRRVHVLPDGRVLCYTCRCRAQGRSTVEADHIAGRAAWGSLTVRLNAEDHRTVTDLRRRLGFDQLPMPGGDPLLALAHFLAGTASLLVLLVEWLAHLSASLRELYGEGWWRDGPPGPFA